MGVIVCPRCREPFTGAVGSDWLVCLRCQHRWLPSPTTVAEPLDEPVRELALPAIQGSSARDSATTESDEYAPNESGEMKRRTAALINRQGHAQEFRPRPALSDHQRIPDGLGFFENLERRRFAGFHCRFHTVLKENGAANKM